MTKGVLSTIIDGIGGGDAEQRAESYVMVNVRPGEKVAVMLDLLSKLSGKSPSALATDKISHFLAEYAASSIVNTEAVLNAAVTVLEQRDGYGFQDGSALAVLQSRGIVAIKGPQHVFFPSGA
jgi:hypothetical protein